MKAVSSGKVDEDLNGLKFPDRRRSHPPTESESGSKISTDVSEISESEDQLSNSRISHLKTVKIRTANKFDILNSSVHGNEDEAYLNGNRSQRHVSRKTVQFQKDPTGVDDGESGSCGPLNAKEGKQGPPKVIHRSKSQSPKRVEPKHDAMANEEKLKEKVDGFKKKVEEASAAVAASGVS